MGAIHMSVADFHATLSEILGIKAGLAVDVAELNELLAADEVHPEYSELQAQGGLRIESTVFEEIVEGLLFRLGRLKKRQNLLPGLSLMHESRNDPEQFEAYLGVMQLYNQWLRAKTKRVRAANDKGMDPAPFVLKAAKKFGKRGADLAFRVIDDQIAYQYRSPWGALETSSWKNTLELKALFESEGLNAYYGTFLDQRYIDFLNRNFDFIDQIHWRKFEQLSAEFLEREGYRVDLGPGRGDDGVDVRAWPKEASEAAAPAIIVQCKRQKATIEKVIVKSLYADVLHEKAESGLIVTTSRLSPGAAQTADARHYPIEVADRETLRLWLEQLHTPGTGVILE